ncbi:hypothetical protein SLE2022_359210 [Rubroshorea leprosula]
MGLMLVERYENETETPVEPPRAYKTDGFNVLLLESNEWSKIANSGDNLIFLGYNASVLISSLHSPRLERNCIYYTDDNMFSWEDDYGGFDNVIFDLDKERIKEFEELHLDSQLVWPPPIWVMLDP